jgi:hypothetical protein
MTLDSRVFQYLKSRPGRIDLGYKHLSGKQAYQYRGYTFITMTKALVI